MKCFKNYTPITAMPYRHSESYVEIEPCAALKPYIRCFWGSRDIYTLEAGVGTENVVVPDTCMEVILTVNIRRTVCRIYFAASMTGRSQAAAQIW